MGLAVTASQAQTFYENDFESNTTANFSAGSITLAPNSSTSFLGRFSGSAPTSTTLSLAGLSAHTDLTISFDLYVIQSWDGTGNLGSGPDALKFTADGTVLLDATFANRIGSTQSYSDATPLGGGPFDAKTDADAEANLGYADFFGSSTTYNLSFTIAHSASDLSLVLEGFGLQDIGDESWGIDNVVVAAPVPEPATLAVVGLGLVAMRRRLRR